MASGQNWLSKYPEELVSAIKSNAVTQRTNVYVVGGTVRDWLQGILARDLDLAVRENGVAFAQNLALLLRGTFVLLDQKEGVGRVVWEKFIIDIAEFRYGTSQICDDLQKRDFTINAMAFPFCIEHAENEEIGLIDPCSGQEDLNKGIIRAMYDNTFIDDPLRLLRAYRFSSVMGFLVEENSEKIIKRDAHHIEKVSPERVTYELNEIMASERAGETFERLTESGLLWCLFPELQKGEGLEQPASHHLDVFSHNLATLGAMEEVITNPGEFFPGVPILDQYLEDAKKKVRLKWAALLHDVGKPDAMKMRDQRITFYNHDRAGLDICNDIGHRLRWSKEDLSHISCLVGYHMWPFHLSNIARKGEVSSKAILKMVKTIGDDLPGLFALAMADSLAGQGPDRPANIEMELVDLFLKVDEVVRNQIQPVMVGPKLIRGQDLIDLKLTPGPVFREILDEIEQAQVSGEVNDRKQALGLLKQIISERNLL
jgi:poly(A) polymerase